MSGSNNKGWSKEHIQYLKDNFDKMSYNQIGAHIGRKGNAVRRYVQRVGLKKIAGCRKPKIHDKEPEEIKQPITRPVQKYFQGGYLETINKYLNQ